MRARLVVATVGLALAVSLPAQAQDWFQRLRKQPGETQEQYIDRLNRQKEEREAAYRQRVEEMQQRAALREAEMQARAERQKAERVAAEESAKRNPFRTEGLLVNGEFVQEARILVDESTHCRWIMWPMHGLTPQLTEDGEHDCEERDE